MKKMLLPILMVCFSFAQFEAGKKMVGGHVSNFVMDNTTWTVNDCTDCDDISWTLMNVDMSPSGSYFVIDNFALSAGLDYSFTTETWMIGDEEYEVEESDDELAPFGFMVGGAYYMGDAYGHASFNQVKPMAGATGDPTQYLSFGGGYLVQLFDGVYLDTKVEYRHMLGDASAEAPATAQGPIADYLATYEALGLLESTSLKLYGSVGVSVVF